MKLRTIPVLAATLVLAGVTLLASAAPVARSQAPQGPTTPILDNFNRPNEDPLSGGGNWARLNTTDSNDLELFDMRVRQRPACCGDIATRYWTPQPFGADQEVHFKREGSVTLGEGWRVILRAKDVGGANTWDGYLLILHQATAGRRWYIYKRENTSFIQLAIVAHDYMSWVLFRAVGSQLQGWGSNDGVNWTPVISATDTSFPNGGYLGLGTERQPSGSFVPQIDDFGGGTVGGPPPPPPSGGGDQSTGTFCKRGGWALTGTCTLSDPVNTFTGAFVTQVEDLATPGTGVPFAWTRSYTSSGTTVGALGPGWTHTYAASLSVQGNGDVIARGEEGQQLYFTKQGDGSFVGAPGALATLSLVGGQYKLVRNDQVTYTFTAQGVLQSIKDRNDQGVTLAYDGQGRLSTITDAAGKQVTVSYNASNLISQVQTQDARSVSYAYTSGRLTSVTDVRAKTWTYTYDGGGRLATIVDPLNHTQVTNVYGSDGRVQSQTNALGKTTTFAWDQATEVMTATDANNKVWKHDYEGGVLAKEIDPLNNVTQFSHDADLNVSSVTGPTNQTTAMTYDAASNPLTATAPASLGSVQKTFVYNSRNDPTQVTDARGKVTSYTYTPLGNTQTMIQDGAQIGSYTYDSAGRVLTFTDGRNKTWTYTYFPTTGYLESETDPLGNKTTYTYDAVGRVLTRVDPKGNVAGCGCASQFTWSYTYNPAGQLLTQTDPLGNTTTHTYDDVGNELTITNANGKTTTFTYDNANRVASETAPDPDGAGPLTSPVMTYTYDDVGNKLTETDPRGNTTTFGYDAANRLVSETGPDPDGAGPLSAPVTTYAYDANGNLQSAVEPRGNVAGCNCASDFRTNYTYDAAGRMLTETKPDPDGAGPQIAPVTTKTYDVVGNLASVRDGSNHTTSYTHDAAGRILTATASDSGVTTYTYDGAGNLLTRRDDNNHTSTFAYDDAGRLASETGPDPDGAGTQSAPLTTHTYDENGNALTLTDANGNATPAPGDGQAIYGYDRANRPTSVNYSDLTPDVTFTYDAVGNRLTVADGSGMETRTYDNLDRLLSVTRGVNTFSYAYDAGSNLTSRTYPSGAVTTYTYDALNRLSTAENASLSTSYAYDVASNLTTTTLPSANSHKETRVYDNAGRLIEVNNERTSPSQLRDRFLITLDPVGNPTQIVRTGALSQTQTYSYDASDRILSVCFAASCVAGSPNLVSWTYDKVGNRLTETRSTGTTSYSYDARDRLLSAGATSYTYDANGNELSAGSTTFTYDLANRLKTAVQGATTTTYTYDGEDKRLQASTGTQNSQKTNFLWDVSHPLSQLAQERNGANTLQRQYIYGVKRIRQTQGTGTYYLYDGLGSVSNTTAPLGALQKTYSYEPYGPIRTESGSSPTNFLHFTGEYRDPTGLYHLRARQYDPATGRFLRRDPVDAGVGSPFVATYVYASNRPGVFTDPSGEKPFRPSEDGQNAADAPSSAHDFIPFIPGGCPAQPGYPLGAIGEYNGGPKDHEIANRGTGFTGWASNRAIDLNAPWGTRVCAIFDGTVSPPGYAFRHTGEGRSLYLVGKNDVAFFQHLSGRVVQREDKVNRGQLLGFVGCGSNGAVHLHLALEMGKPLKYKYPLKRPPIERKCLAAP